MCTVSESSQSDPQDATSNIDRRRFVRLCASALALAGISPQLLAQESDATLRRYQRVRLVDADGKTLRATDLRAGENYVFHYPYVSTPCFLLNLGEAAPGGAQLSTSDGHAYTWQGGVGPQRSVVAFSAICAHRMTYPAHSVSFINYRPKTVTFLDKHDAPEERSHVIYCCSEKSVYDATQGARVLGGPAPQPLAAIVLEYEDKDGGLFASGTYGGALFQRFFDKFGFHLSLEYLNKDIRQEVSQTAAVVPLSQYSATQVLC